MSQLPSKERIAELRPVAVFQRETNAKWSADVIDECLNAVEELSIAVDFADAATELVRKERDELLKDKARLEWMAFETPKTEKPNSVGVLEFHTPDSFRAAIDAAMTGGEK